MRDDDVTRPCEPVDISAPPSNDGPRIRIVYAEADDPETFERFVQALADVLAGRVG